MKTHLIAASTLFGLLTLNAYAADSNLDEASTKTKPHSHPINI